MSQLHRARNAVLAAILVAAALIVSAAPASAEEYSSTPVGSWSLNGRVHASVVVGNRVILGGTFTTATSPSGASVSRSRLAAFDVRTGALDTAFNPGADGTVRALASDGATVWVGGVFSRIGTVTRARLAAVSATSGALRTGFTASANAGVLALDVRAGKLYVGGDFTTLSGRARSRAGAVDAVTGAVDAGFVPSIDARVAAVRVSPTASTAYLGGSFARVNGAARTGLAAVDLTTGSTRPATFAGSVSPTLSVDVRSDGSEVYAAQGGSGNSAVAWRSAGGTRLWSQRADGDVQTVRYDGGDVFFGFHDGFGGTTTTKLLAANATTGVLDRDFRPVFNGFWGIFTVAVADGYLVAGGEFTQVGGVRAGSWARFPVG